MAYSFHPAAELFPMLSTTELTELADDIAQHGLHEPIKLYDGQVLDGRNRYQACQQAGVQPIFEDLPDTINPWDYVWSENVVRRHLTPGQTAILKLTQLEESAKWRRMVEEKASRLSQPRNESGHFQRLVSHEANGPFYVYRSPKKLGISQDPPYIGSTANLERRAQEHQVNLQDLEVLHTCQSIEEAGHLEREEKERLGLSTKSDGGPSGHQGLGHDWSEDHRTVGIPGRTREMLAHLSRTSPATAERAIIVKRASTELAHQVGQGEISLNEAMRILKKAEVAEKAGALPDGTYRIIYADPPWKYGNSGSEIDQYGPAERHYPAMSLPELCALDIKSIAADNAVLFLWVTSPMLEDSFPIIKAWGFQYKTSFVWDKVKHNFGHYNSVRHELLLICTRGSCTPDHNELFDSVVTLERSEHSEKPEHFRMLIDTMYPIGPRIELFARKEVTGWNRWGNE